MKIFETSSIASEPPLHSAIIDPSLEQILKYLPDGVYVRDCLGKLKITNAILLGLLDLEPEAEELPESFKLAASRSEQQVIKTCQSVSDVDVSIQLSDERFFKLTCIPWLGSEGQLMGTIGMVRDVTQVVLREKELAESRNLLQSVLEHLPVRVFWKDRDLIYLGCNTVFANDMGFESPQQLIGQDDFVTVMTHEESEICRAEDFHVVESGESRYGSEELIGSGEDQTWIRVSKVPLYSASGETLGVLGMYENINEQKQSQIELENALRRERELNELKTSFVATVSHEYRNPLATIKTYADTMILLGDKLDQSQREQRLEIIRGSVTRMATLMSDVLFIGREEFNDRIDHDYTALDLKLLCREAIKTLNLLDTDFGRIQIDFLGQARPFIGIQDHLTRTIQNLIINAIKYSDEQITLTLDWKPDTVEITVKDSGIGISEQELPHVFDSFFRSPDVGTIEGSGLGLYIVKRAVDLHHGSVELTSELGSGTQVHVTLPYTHPAKE